MKEKEKEMVNITFKGTEKETQFHIIENYYPFLFSGSDISRNRRAF